MADRDEKALRGKLAEAESIIDALRTGKIDAVVGEQQVLLLRLREVEEELRRSEARYRGIVEDQADLVFRWDAEGRLTFANEAFCRFLQQPREALVGSLVEASLPAQTDYLNLQRQLASLGPDRPTLDREHRVERPTGEVRWLSVTHRMILSEQHQPAEVQSVARDITERRRAQEQLRQVNAELEKRVEERTAQLRALLRELDEAEQRERRRLAQFLHDDLQQLLVASKLNLGTVRHEATNDAQQQAVDRAQEALDRSIAASRSLVSQLSPPALQHAGLLAALRWLAGQMQEMHQLPVAVAGDPQAEPETDHLRDLLFAFARELLFNVAKHAKAGQAWLGTRRRADGQIEIEVRDDGIGFDPAASVPPDQRPTTFGLWSIEERLQLLGGGLHVDSAPGQGCRITLAAPASVASDEGSAPKGGRRWFDQGRSDRSAPS